MQKNKFLVSLLLAVMVPFVCFLYVWNKGGNGHIKLPPYFVIDSIKNKNGKPDTFFHRAKDIEFVNQLGDTLSMNNTFNKKIVVFNLFNTKDSITGLQLNKNMQFLQKVYKKNYDTIAFVSIAINKPIITQSALRNYANLLNADHDKWQFVNNINGSLENYLNKEINYPDLYKQLENGPNKFVLLDADRNIRGYYNALDTFEIRHCADDISLLMLEKKRKH